MKRVTMGLAVALAASAALAAQAAPVSASQMVVLPGIAPAAAQPHAAARPRVSTKRLIIRAVYASPLTDAVPDSQYTVEQVRVSKVAPAWASAWLQPKRGVELDPAQAVLRKTKSAWQVVDLGTAEVGCGIVPVKAHKDLRVNCS